MVRPRVRIIFLLVAIEIAILQWPSVVEFMRIDTCLDRGGRWDYSENRCDGFIEGFGDCIEAGGWIKQGECMTE